MTADVVLIAGASGLIGSHLTAALRARGTTVRHLVRGPARRATEMSWDPDNGQLSADALQDVTAVVNLGGAGLGDRRWTTKYRRVIRDSRINGTRLLAEAIAAEEAYRHGHAATSSRPPIRFLQASAVGYYGDRGEEPLTESSADGEGFLAELCRDWEAATEAAAAAGAAVTLLRTGIVLSPRGGAMGPLLPLLRWGLAGPLGGGKQWWPWISLHDHIRALLHLLDGELRGPVNLAAPGLRRQGAVIKDLAAAMHRPAVLPVPRFALRIALGAFADDVLASQKVLPTALLSDRFAFTHPTSEAAAAWVARHLTRKR